MGLDRIRQNVVVDSNGCWIWQKSKNSAGYGQLTEGKKYWLTHVYAYVCVNGALPTGFILRHSCHKRSCCNPDHLLKGTHKDNWVDSKEVHLGASKKQRKGWKVLEVEYPTVREANLKTGLSLHSLVRFTKEGVFDVEGYRASCRLAGWIPKV